MQGYALPPSCVKGIIPKATNGLQLTGTGTLQGNGLVDAQFDGEAGTTLRVTNDMAIGDTAKSLGFETDGAVEVLNATATLRTLVSARLGRSTSIDQGALVLDGPGAFLLEAGDTLEGGGSLVGPVDASAGSIVTPSPTLGLTLGSATSTLGVAADGGEFRVGPGSLTLLDADAARLQNITTLAGGSLAAPNGILLQSSGSIVGGGTVDADVQNDGLIEVGDPIGTLTVTEDFSGAGTLAIQVGGAGPAPSKDASPGAAASKSASVVCDRLDILGSLNAFQMTLRIGHLPGLAVAPGDTLTIVTFGGPVSTSFGSVVFDDPNLDNIFDVVDGPNTVLLVATAATDVPIFDPPTDDSGPDVARTPTEFALRVVGSNPALLSSGTALEYDVPVAASPVSIAVFDASGRLVSRLVDGVRPAGRHHVEWRGGDLARLSSGVYFLRMDAGRFHETARVVMIR